MYLQHLDQLSLHLSNTLKLHQTHPERILQDFSSVRLENHRKLRLWKTCIRHSSLNRSSFSLWILISTFFTSLSAFFHLIASHAPTFLSLSGNLEKKLPTVWGTNQEFVVTSLASGKTDYSTKTTEKMFCFSFANGLYKLLNIIYIY